MGKVVFLLGRCPFLRGSFIGGSTVVYFKHQVAMLLLCYDIMCNIIALLSNAR